MLAPSNRFSKELNSIGHGRKAAKNERIYEPSQALEKEKEGKGLETIALTVSKD